MPDRGLGLTHLARGPRVEGILLALHRPTGAHVRGVAPDPLRDKPLHSDRLAGGEQIVGSLGPQPVRQRERAVEMTHVGGADRGQLVHDDIRLRLGDSPRDLVGIEGVRDHRRGSEVAKQRLL